MTSKIVVNNIEADAGVSTVTFGSKISSTEFVGNLTGTASTATAAATAYGLSGSPTLSGITSVSTSNLTVNGNNYPSAGPLSNRNKIINGDCRIDQRNSGSSGTATGSFTVDRWFYFASQASKGTWQQNAGSVTPPVGFDYYLGYTSSSSYTLLSGDLFGIAQSIEGYNISDLEYGTANAKPITISFWVRSSLTGLFGGFLKNGGTSSGNNTRFCPFSYTINSANTWEYKTITINGDTTGSWESTNGPAFSIGFSLGNGSSYVGGTSGTWSGSIYLQPPGCVDIVATSGATLYLTGVQIEVGTVATPFEHRSYGQELALCQRYYQVTGISSTGGPPTNAYGGYIGATYPNNASSYGTARFHTTMRTIPAVVLYDNTGASGTATQNGSANGISASAAHITPYGFNVVQRSSGVWTDDARYTIYAGYTASAEI